MAFPLLRDPIRAVRLEAISLLINIPQGDLPEIQQKLFQQATEEYIQFQQFNFKRISAQPELIEEPLCLFSPII